MHIYPILLVQAENLAEAKIMAEVFIERSCGEHSCFDYGSVVADTETEWNKPLLEIADKLPPDTHMEDAIKYIAKANIELERKNHGQAGYYFHKAGELLQEMFCVDVPVFNVMSDDYSRDCSEGWYAIEADLHF